MKFDERMTSARDDLAAAFDHTESPRFKDLQARQRRRRVASGGAVALVLLAATGVALTTGDDHDPQEIVMRPSTTIPSPDQVTTTAPTATTGGPTATTSPAPTTTTTPPARAQGDFVLAASGPEPENAVAVREDGALVRLRTPSGEVAEQLARKGDPTKPRAFGDRTPVITTGAMTPTGRMFYDECCGMGAGVVHEAKKSETFAVGDLPALAPNGRRLAVYHRELFDVRVVDVESGHIVRRLRVRPDVLASGEVMKLALADDGRVAVETFSTVDSIAIYDASSTEPDQKLRPHPARKGRSYTDPVFLPDGRLLVVEQRVDRLGEVDQRVPSVLTALGASGRPTGRLPLAFSVADLAVSQSGHLLAIGTDHVVRAFDGHRWHVIARGDTAADW